MAAKKKSGKRPPRSLWFIHNPSTGSLSSPYGSKASAKKDKADGLNVVGPYALAERVSQR